jgi:hypothetical protein
VDVVSWLARNDAARWDKRLLKCLINILQIPEDYSGRVIQDGEKMYDDNGGPSP